MVELGFKVRSSDSRVCARGHKLEASASKYVKPLRVTSPATATQVLLLTSSIATGLMEAEQGSCAPIRLRL